MDGGKAGGMGQVVGGGLKGSGIGLPFALKSLELIAPLDNPVLKNKSLDYRP